MKHSIVSILLFWIGIFLAEAQTNTLSIPSVSSVPGKTILLPVNLDNTSDVVAIQFSLTVPAGVTLQGNKAELTERGEGLEVEMREIEDGRYMAMIFSTNNKTIRGRSGTLLKIPLQTSTSLSEGSSYKMILSDVVIGAKNGDNVATGYNVGDITIMKSPDLEVSDVRTTLSKVSPGESLDVNWKVTNIGGLSTEDGWKENIFLVASNGKEKLLSTVYFKDVLAAGSVASRSVTFIIPEIIGIDGDAQLKVCAVPNSSTGEPNWQLGNNEATSEAYLTIQKKLSITPYNVEVEEDNNDLIRLFLSRSGNTDKDDVFQIAQIVDSRVSVPNEVIIPKGQSGSYFYLNIIPNGLRDENSLVNISVSGSGYESVVNQLTIQDDVLPKLYLSADCEELSEGESIRFTVNLEKASENDMEILLGCDYPNRFVIPKVEIPAGQTKIEAVVKAIEDDEPDITKYVTFTASALGYSMGICEIDLLDNDVPSIELELTPDVVSEDAGPLSVVGKVRRVDNLNKKVKIRLTDDSDEGLYYGRTTLEMLPGVEEISFALGPIDNDKVDGERTYNITASVWIPSCSCSASNGTSGGVVVKPLTVYDNDGPTLTLKSSVSSVNENGEMEVVVERNTEISTALSINISSNKDENLIYPDVVTIPVGKQSSSFIVKAKDNDVSDDSTIVIMTAECDGYSKGNMFFMITDQTLPDAVISHIEVDENQVSVGDKVTVTVCIKNIGATILPELTKVGFYVNSDISPVEVAYLQEPLFKGDSIILSKKVDLPKNIGESSVFAIVNYEQVTKELFFNNNASQQIIVNSNSPYSFTLYTDKNVYDQGEYVNISGRIIGSDISNKPVEIYILRDYRQVISTVTDEYGCFKAQWQPYSTQGGHYIIGACYPQEGIDKEFVAIDIRGINIETNKKGIESYVGETYTGSFVIRNPGELELDNVVCRVLNGLESCDIQFENNGYIGSISPNDAITVPFSIIGKKPSVGKDFEKIQISVSGNGDIETTGLLYYYCFPQYGKLETESSNISCTVMSGESRDVPIEITNIGKGDTGIISLSIISPWITTATPIKINSLAFGEKAKVVLRLDSKDMQLNVPRTGVVGVNCENGEGLSINIVMEPVSELTGHLSVDVCDQYTYNTIEAPHLEGAEVRITHPINKNIEVAHGFTDKNGLFEIDLPEGYYSIFVMAESHESYNNNILINPGKDNYKKVDLSYTGGIEVKYIVEPIEGGIEDKYEIITKVEFETNVPVPVVLLEGPKSIDAMSMYPGESVVLNYVATNKGLVTALEHHIVLPEACEDYSMTPLYDDVPQDIPANSSVVYPILFTRNPYYKKKSNTIKRAPGDDIAQDFNSCMAGFEHWYRDKCGSELRDNHGAVMLALKACAYSSMANAVMCALSNLPQIWHPSNDPGPVGPNGGPGGNNTPGSDYDPFVGIDPDRSICNPDVAEAANDGINMMLGAGLGPIASAVNTGVDLAIETAVDGRPSAPTVIGAIISAVTPFMSEGFQMFSGALQNLGNGLAWFVNHGHLFTGFSHNSRVQKQSKLPDWMVYMGAISQKMYNQMSAVLAIQDEIFGNHSWIDHYDPTMLPLVQRIEELSSSGVAIDIDMVSDYKPESVSNEMLKSFVDRFNNIVYSEKGNNVLDTKKIEDAANIIRDVDSYAIDNGYGSMEEMYRSEYEKYIAIYNENSNSVCSSITLQFNQKLILTREAFRGTLTVYNGHDSESMKDIVLNLTVSDETGKPVSDHEMTIEVESVSNFENTSSNSNWALSSKETGKATILYIPTKYAAYDTPMDYVFSGSLEYTNPYNGLRVTESFSPVTLTVHPSPNLNLTYFMQRDVIGDDPLTEAIEPSEEAEFSLLITNIGYGDATNVSMVTDQPKIIDNEKGLLIDFELISSQLNGGDKVLAFGNSAVNNFGTIPAQSSAYAQWWIRSSLLGHFIDYNVKANHITSYDNPDLSLLNNVSIHELIRSIDIEADLPDKLIGFVANDIPDMENLPDMIYISNGDVEYVHKITSSEIIRLSDTEYLLKLAPSDSGWNYGYISDPTYGMAKLRKIVRQHDGKEVSIRNFWQTDRTMRDGKEPLYENMIHFIDCFSQSSDRSYILTFEALPELLLDVVSIDGIPGEEVVAQSPIKTVTVMFNKYIDASTFTSEDITLTVQGKKQDSALIKISTEDNKVFNLDFEELNNITGNGYYVLSINTADIIDIEGFNGKNGKSVGWNMYIDGTVLVNTSVYPENAGKVIGVHNVKYGEKATFTHETNDGYIFSHWSIDDKNVSDMPEWSGIVLGDLNLTANFRAKVFGVTVEANGEYGIIEGNQSGIYSYGDEISIEAKPINDYRFVHWLVNDKVTGEDNPKLNLVVSNETKVIAVFKYVGLYYQSVDVSSGWSWISHRFLPSLNVDAFMNDGNLIRLLSQTKEVIRDSKYGIVGTLSNLTPDLGYKVESNGSSIINLSGYCVVDEPMPISINAGWNWIGYPCGFVMYIKDAFALSAVNENDIIVGQEGFSLFDGDDWVGTLNVLTPGCGYMYYSESENTITYPMSSLVPVRRAKMRMETNRLPLVIDIHKYPSVMPVVAAVTGAGGAPLENAGFEVSAFCGSECRGVGRIVEGLFMMSVYGNAGDEISFRITDAGGTMEYHNSESLKFGERVVGSLDNPYTLMINSSTGVENVSYSGDVKISVEEDMLLIRGVAPEDIELVEMYDIDGRKLLRETNVSESGIRLSGAPAGVYVVIVKANGEYTYHKTTLR